MEKCNSERSDYDWHGDCCASNKLCCHVAPESVHSQRKVLRGMILSKVRRDHPMIGIYGLNSEVYLYMAGGLSPLLMTHRPSKRLTGKTDLPKLWNSTVSLWKLVSGIVKRQQHKCTRAIKSS